MRTDGVKSRGELKFPGGSDFPPVVYEVPLVGRSIHTETDGLFSVDEMYMKSVRL